jgi:hypothetical protein
MTCKSNKGLFYLLKDKKLMDVFQELEYLEIPHKQRKELVNICYKNQGYKALFLNILNSEIKEANKNNLNNTAAYSAIKNELDRQSKLIREINNNPFNIILGAI